MTTKQADDELGEDPARPFERSLHDYLNDFATVDALGAKCRDAAHQLVSEVISPKVRNARNLWMSVGRRTLPTSPVQGIE
jgi:hypothetical protein